MRRGPLYMVLASGFFIAMVGLAKVARQTLGPLEIIFWRSLVSVPIAFLVAGSVRGLRLTNPRALLVRSLFGFAAMVCVFTAARGLPLADLSIIGKLQPLIVALAAPYVLGQSERAPAATWIALCVGLIGSALIIAPRLDIGNAYGLWALAAAVFSAAAHLGVRLLGRTNSTRAIVFWFQSAILVYSGVGYLLLEGRLPPLPGLSLWPQLIGIGIAATAGQLLMTRAYMLDRAAIVAGAAYTAPLFAIAGDIVVFGELPGTYPLVGGLLVIGAGLLLLKRGSEPEGAGAVT